MNDKIKTLLGSLRFWQVTGATAFVILGHYLPGMEFLWNTLAGYFAVVAGIGSLDSIAEKISSKKPVPPPSIT